MTEPLEGVLYVAGWQTGSDTVLAIVRRAKGQWYTADGDFWSVTSDPDWWLPLSLARHARELLEAARDAKDHLHRYRDNSEVYKKLRIEVALAGGHDDE